MNYENPEDRAKASVKWSVGVFLGTVSKIETIRMEPCLRQNPRSCEREKHVTFTVDDTLIGRMSNRIVVATDAPRRQLRPGLSERSNLFGIPVATGRGNTT